ncbi:MAG: saccharopine dehydrogenase NADP-binding domain-containing protein [Emcibacter sp.]|nr:saccharopine dehydrogenase NADP-binding domain-containing protein [Emcibacter sp.]
MSSPSIKQRPAIHWIGAGLASGPGIIALAKKWGNITVWDMSSKHIEDLKSTLTMGEILTYRPLNIDDDIMRTEFCTMLHEGDIIISMLPASFHIKVANIALAEKCHLVTSSYLSDEMRALDKEAKSKNICLVNEVGLDPGIDHLFTHLIVDAARQKGILGKGDIIDFISYCGGIPAKNTPFTYKFSWTPLGVLTALTNPARFIKDCKEHAISKAWEEVSELSLYGEKFEVYPNRNSLPYIEEYGLSGEKNLRNFVRGTMRLSGWKKAWKEIFSFLEYAPPQDLKTLSDQLWQDHQYKADEQDRVVLYVALSATKPATENDTPYWTGSLSLDMIGQGWQSAMASCVSLTVSEAVNAVMDGRLSSGVGVAPHDIKEAKMWLKNLQKQGIPIQAENIDLT